MKINPIGYRYNSINFGHSKKSQKYIEDKAKNTLNARYGEALLNTANVCNDVEVNLKKEEKRIKSIEEDHEFSSHVDLFLALKQALLINVINIFPDCEDYIKSEYDYYNNSLKHCKGNLRNDFREGYVDILESWGAGNTPHVTNEKVLQAETQNKAECKNKTKEDKKLEEQNIKEPEIKNEAPEQKQAENEKEKKTEISISELAKLLLEKTRTENVMLEVLLKQKGSPESFKDVMGMEKLKEDLQENIIDPVNNPEKAELDFKEYGKKMPMGILLYGPPGCGKTYIVEALANETDTVVYTLDIGKAGSRFVNQTSNNIKASFDYVKTMAKQFPRPVILFMDEIDSMTMKRGSGYDGGENLKQVATLLKCIEDAQKNNVIVVGATNRYDLLDPAVIRRFDMKRFVGAPVQEQRKQQVVNNLSSKEKAKNILSDDKALDKIAHMLEDYSYKSINVISNEAALRAMKRNRADISLEDFVYAIENTNEEKIKDKDYKKQEKALIGFGS